MAQRIMLPTKIQYTTDNDEESIFGIDISPDLIKLKIDVKYKQTLPSLEDGQQEPTIVEQTKTHYNIEIPLSELKLKENFKSNTLFGLKFSQENSQKIVVPSRRISNISADTLTQRSVNPSNMTFVGLSYILILVKDPNGDFTDHDIIVYTSDNTKAQFISNVEFTTQDNPQFNHLDLLDSITYSKDATYINEEYIKYNVSSEAYVDELDVQSIVGITDKSRIKLTNGQGSFRILKSSVENQFDVRVGFMSYPRLISIVGTV